MFQRIAGFFRRIFKSRGFRRGTRILFWMAIGIIIYNLVMILIAFTSTDIPLWDALRFFFSLSPFEFDFVWPLFILIFLTIGLGLIRYFQGKEESRNPEEDKKEEKPELSDPVQEEFPEPKHYQYH